MKSKQPQCPVRDDRQRFGLSSLTGLKRTKKNRQPSTEVLGYFRVSLPGQKQDRSVRVISHPNPRSLSVSTHPISDAIRVEHGLADAADAADRGQGESKQPHVAERHLAVAVGFNPRWVMTCERFVAERRLNARITNANKIGRRSRGDGSIVAPRRDCLAG